MEPNPRARNPEDLIKTPGYIVDMYMKNSGPTFITMVPKWYHHGTGLRRVERGGGGVVKGTKTPGLTNLPLLRLLRVFFRIFQTHNYPNTKKHSKTPTLKNLHDPAYRSTSYLHVSFPPLSYMFLSLPSLCFVSSKFLSNYNFVCSHLLCKSPIYPNFRTTT